MDSDDVSESSASISLLVYVQGKQAPHRLNSEATSINQLKKELKAALMDDDTAEMILSFYDTEFQEYVFLDDLRQLGSKAKVMIFQEDPKRSSSRLSPRSLAEIYLMLRDPQRGIKVKSRVLKFKTYNNCVSGADICDWMGLTQHVDRAEAVLIGAALLKEHYIHHVTYSCPFEDKSNCLYQFQNLGDLSRADKIPKYDCDEIMLGLLSSSKGIQMKCIKDGFKKYKDCFTGTEAVNWISTNLNIRRNVAISIGSKLMGHGFFHHVTHSRPFADEPFIYTTMGGKRPQYEFPAQRIVRLLQQLKADDMFHGSESEIDYVIRALGQGSRTLFNVSVEELLADAKADRETSSLVLSHTGSSSSLPTFPKKKIMDASGESLDSRRLSIPHMSDPLHKMLEKVFDWNFDIFKFFELAAENGLPLLAATIFQKHDLFKKLNISHDKFNNLFHAISKGYRKENPYHNCVHAADVLQTTNYFLSRGRFSQLPNDVEIAACLFSAAAHDIDHPGFNNAFLINSRSPLAIRYNDLSVLENHHCATAFSILLQPENNIFCNVSQETFNQIRKVVIKIILSTDFGKHFDYVGQFKSATANVDVDMQKQEIKDLYLEICVKCADISHAAKQLPIHLDWTNCVTEEFYHQGDEEKRLGMNVSPLMDRITGNVAKSQIGFINFMVMPLYECWVEEFEEYQECAEQLFSNLNYWKHELEKQLPPPSTQSKEETTEKPGENKKKSKATEDKDSEKRKKEKRSKTSSTSGGGGVAPNPAVLQNA